MLKEMGFQQSVHEVVVYQRGRGHLSVHEAVVYWRGRGHSVLLVGIYIDDLIITDTEESEVEAFKA
jgi:hypothetical protein